MKKCLKIILAAIAVIVMVTIFASCVKEPPVFKVDFDADGVIVWTQERNVLDIEAGAPVVLPPTPTKEGYIFDGWYRDKDTWQEPFTEDPFSEMQTEDLTVYAKWIPFRSLTIDGFTETEDHSYRLTVASDVSTLDL